MLTRGRETLNGIDVVRLHAPFRWLESTLRLYTTHKNTDAFYIWGFPGLPYGSSKRRSGSINPLPGY